MPMAGSSRHLGGVQVTGDRASWRGRDLLAVRRVIDTVVGRHIPQFGEVYTLQAGNIEAILIRI